MPIVNTLALDHFYISLNEQDFQKYLPFLKELNANHSVVNSSNDSWEGIYLYSRIQDCFEILKERRPGGVGIALSPFRPTNTDVSLFKSEMPDLKWFHGEMLYSDKKPWFDWYSLNQYLNKLDSFFNVWIMEYKKTHVDHLQRPKPKIVDCFDSLDVCLGKIHKQVILDNLKFTDFKIDCSEHFIKVAIPRKDGWDFELNIELLDDESFFKPKKLSFQFYHGHKPVISHYDFISLTDDKIDVHF